ncbi:nuclear transport factor 2 family protein [Parabacteroides sp. FAFU027]|uniref:nuclear transport factor 2 family protein n=1 Tax=Parabacteroides sp. FAFU027 TaxID=2922715 RepID=UPI001FAFF59E|nr:nuclear transport factor 2 family protein [Parabacteroides sp. FAFU027]
MKKTILFILILVGLLTAFQQINQKDDSDKLKSVLMDYLNALKNKDIKKMNALTTTDFVIFEDGKVLNNDSLINFFNSFPKIHAEYKLDNFKINVDNNSGYMRYFNHGEFTINDTTHLIFNWLESATFKKVNNKWKLNFLHSTVRKR